MTKIVKKITKFDPNLGFSKTPQIGIAHLMLHTQTMALPMPSMG
jgi:hypothetical protein